MLSQLLIVSLLIAVGINAATAAQLSYGNCEVKGSKEHGSCIHIRDCPFLYEILKIQMPTEAQRQLLSDSQCGLDNTRQTTLVQRILVCCPDSNRKTQDTAAETPIANRSGDESQPGNVLPSIGTCGIMFANRIIGGTKTQIFEFPWMVLVQYKNPSSVMGFLCGGTLINSRYVLTAGHCLNSSKLKDGNWEVHGVRLGEWDTSTAPDCVTELSNKKSTCAPMHIDIEVEKKVMHEQYLPNSIDQRHDIALLRLKQTVSYTEYVKPICLPVAEDVRNKNYEGYAMDVAGWGATDNNDKKPSTVKLKITVDVWNLQKCQEKYRSFQMHLNGSQLCAGGKVNIDTCQGDSGGPLMIPTNVGNQEVFFVAGVVSYGPTPCGLQGWPGVYTRVGNYIDWIESKLES